MKVAIYNEGEHLIRAIVDRDTINDSQIEAGEMGEVTHLTRPNSRKSSPIVSSPSSSIPKRLTFDTVGAGVIVQDITAP